MSQKNDYILILNDLPDGKHNFEYELNNDFFAQFDEIEINQGNIKAEIVVEKRHSNINLTFNIKGKVSVPCDRCLDEMSLPIDAQEKFLVKIDGFSNDDTEIIVLNEKEDLNISWLLYELIATSMPMQHTHEEGQCNRETMKQFNRYIVAEKDNNLTDINQSKTDPRWDALKNINDNI